jgi:hypothetical protein
LLLLHQGAKFTEEGFDSVMEYVYTSAVTDVTHGVLNVDKLKATLQAAKYFNPQELHTAARKWAQQCGFAIPTDLLRWQWQ